MQRDCMLASDFSARIYGRALSFLWHIDITNPLEGPYLDTEY